MNNTTNTQEVTAIASNEIRKAAAIASRIAESKNVHELLINRAITYTAVTEGKDAREARYLIDIIRDGGITDSVTVTSWNMACTDLRKLSTAAWQEIERKDGKAMTARNACVKIIGKMLTMLGLDKTADKKDAYKVIRAICGLDRNTDGTTKNPSKAVQDLVRAYLINHESIEKHGKHVVTDEELDKAVNDANKAE